ncbi:MAG: hypothetical protein P8J32_05075 [bacterium]|nr:hypothetical protein [bacterium]
MRQTRQPDNLSEYDREVLNELTGTLTFSSVNLLRNAWRNTPHMGLDQSPPKVWTVGFMILLLVRLVTFAGSLLAVHAAPDVEQFLFWLYVPFVLLSLLYVPFVLLSLLTCGFTLMGVVVMRRECQSHRPSEQLLTRAQATVVTNPWFRDVIIPLMDWCILGTFVYWSVQVSSSEIGVLHAMIFFILFMHAQLRTLVRPYARHHYIRCINAASGDYQP